LLLQFQLKRGRQDAVDEFAGAGIPILLGQFDRFVDRHTAGDVVAEKYLVDRQAQDCLVHILQPFHLPVFQQVFDR